MASENDHGKPRELAWFPTCDVLLMVPTLLAPAEPARRELGLVALERHVIAKLTFRALAATRHRHGCEFILTCSLESIVYFDSKI